MDRSEWVLVPRVPTEAMHQAMPEVSMYVAIDRFRRDFARMLDAAPPPPAEQASGEHVRALQRMRSEWPLALDEGPALDAAIAALSQRPVVDEAAFGDQPMSLRERISFMELEAGSLRALERKTGVDVGYLSRLKSGEKTNPGDDTLQKLGLVRRIGYALAPQQPTGEAGERE